MLSSLIQRCIPPPTRVLLAHEWRLATRGMADMAGPASRTRTLRIGLVLSLMALVVFGVSYVLLAGAGTLDPADPRVRISVAINLAFMAVLMVSAALDSAAYALYARDDYDLLFSAPLSPRTVLLVRALNVFGVTVAKACLYGLPMLLLLALQQGSGWLAGLPTLLAMALGATAAAIALTMAMVRLIGVRRTRAAAQIAAALAGLLVLVAVQWEAIFGPGPKDAMAASHAADPEGLAWTLFVMPARSLMGDLPALLGVTTAALLLAVLVFLTLADSFVRNAVLAAGSTAAAVPRARRSRASFGASAFAVMMLKERRLILRDPWLMSQILMQSIFLLPIAVVSVWRVLNGAEDAGALTPVLIVLGGQIAGGLTWIALSADDAPDLGAAAPVPPRLAARARICAVAWLTAAFVATPLMMVLWFDPWTGLVCLLGMLVAVPCGILVNLWHQPRLARAGMIRRRMKSPVSVTLMELACLTLVAVAAWPLLSGQYLASAAGIVVVCLAMAAMYLSRRRSAAV